MSRKFSHFIPLNGILKCIVVYALVLMIAAKTNIYYYRKLDFCFSYTANYDIIIY